MRRIVFVIILMIMISSCHNGGEKKQEVKLTPEGFLFSLIDPHIDISSYVLEISASTRGQLKKFKDITAHFYVDVIDVDSGEKVADQQVDIKKFPDMVTLSIPLSQQGVYLLLVEDEIDIGDKVFVGSPVFVPPAGNVSASKIVTDAYSRNMMNHLSILYGKAFTYTSEKQLKFGLNFFYPPLVIDKNGTLWIFGEKTSLKVDDAAILKNGEALSLYTLSRGVLRRYPLILQQGKFRDLVNIGRQDVVADTVKSIATSLSFLDGEIYKLYYLTDKGALYEIDTTGSRTLIASNVVGLSQEHLVNVYPFWAVTDSTGRERIYSTDHEYPFFEVTYSTYCTLASDPFAYPSVISDGVIYFANGQSVDLVDKMALPEKVVIGASRVVEIAGKKVIVHNITYSIGTKRVAFMGVVKLVFPDKVRDYLGIGVYSDTYPLFLMDNGSILFFNNCEEASSVYLCNKTFGFGILPSWSGEIRIER